MEMKETPTREIDNQSPEKKRRLKIEQVSIYITQRWKIERSSLLRVLIFWFFDIGESAGEEL